MAAQSLQLRQSLLIVLNSCLALNFDGPQRTTTVNLGPVQQKWMPMPLPKQFSFPFRPI